jgi:hypothetical protein
MALSRTKATTIALSREDDRLLSRAARNARFRDPISSVNISLSCSSNTVGILSREAPESCARYQSAATSASYSVPTASTAALICDTGALLDYLGENAPDHRLFRNAIDKARTRYPGSRSRASRRSLGRDDSSGSSDGGTHARLR